MMWLKFMLMMTFYILVMNELFRFCFRFFLTDEEKAEKYYRNVLKVSKTLSVAMVVILVILIVLLEMG